MDIVVAGVILTMALRVPLNIRSGLAPTWESLAPARPYLLIFAISFLTVSVIWVNHLKLAASVNRVTRSFVWLTLLVLFWIVLIPAATSLLGRNFGDPTATALYGAVMSGMSLSMNAMRLILHRQDRTNADLRVLHVNVTYKAAAAALIYLGAVPLAFISWEASLICFAFVPAMFILTDALGGEPMSPRRETGL